MTTGGKQPDDIDLYMVWKNTEDEYSSPGGKVGEGIENEIVTQESAFTCRGVERILR